MSTSAIVLAAKRKTAGRRLRRESIVAVIFDGTHCLELTEETIDTWWNSLDAEEKADVYERNLGPEEQPEANAQPFPWSILDEANRVSTTIGTLVNAPLSAPDLLESGGLA